jgi:hypothetical protein
MQHFSPDPENNPSDEHQKESVVESTQTKDDVPDHTKERRDDDYYPCPILIDHDASQQRDNHIGKCIKRVE